MVSRSSLICKRLAENRKRIAEDPVKSAQKKDADEIAALIGNRSSKKRIASVKSWLHENVDHPFAHEIIQDLALYRPLEFYWLKQLVMEKPVASNLGRLISMIADDELVDFGCNWVGSHIDKDDSGKLIVNLLNVRPEFRTVVLALKWIEHFSNSEEAAHALHLIMEDSNEDVSDFARNWTRLHAREDYAWWVYSPLIRKELADEEIISLAIRYIEEYTELAESGNVLESLIRGRCLSGRHEFVEHWVSRGLTVECMYIIDAYLECFEPAEKATELAWQLMRNPKSGYLRSSIFRSLLKHRKSSSMMCVLNEWMNQKQFAKEKVSLLLSFVRFAPDKNVMSQARTLLLKNSSDTEGNTAALLKECLKADPEDRDLMQLAKERIVRDPIEFERFEEIFRNRDSAMFSYCQALYINKLSERLETEDIRDSRRFGSLLLGLLRQHPHFDQIEMTKRWLAQPKHYGHAGQPLKTKIDIEGRILNQLLDVSPDEHTVELSLQWLEAGTQWTADLAEELCRKLEHLRRPAQRQQQPQPD